jgi:MFS family permease
MAPLPSGEHRDQASRLTDWRRLPRNVWLVTITSFLTDISSEMVFNLLPLFLANVIGARTGIIGLIEGIAETTASLLKIFSGRLSDRLGRRKELTVAGYSLSAVVKPLLALANSWPWVLVLRFGDRAGKGLRTAPRDALIADSINHKQRGLAYGLHRAGDTAGAAVGLIITLVIVWRFQGLNLSLDRATFQTVAILSVIPAGLAVLVLALGVREVTGTAKLKESPAHSPGRLSGRFNYYLFVVVLFTLGNSSDAFIILRAQERGLSVPGVLGMLITFNLVYALVSGPAGSLSDRHGRRPVLLVGWLAYGLIYLGFAIAGTIWQVWMLFALYGLYYGLSEGVSKAVVADLVPAHQRGMAFGAFNAAVGLAALPASLFAGLLWQGVGPWVGFGPRAPFLFGALLAMAAAFLLARADLTPSAEL